MQNPIEIDYFYSAPTSSFINNNLLSLWFYGSLSNATTPFQKKMMTKKIVKTRNIGILMYMGQFLASIIRAGLFPIRRYILTIILNIFLLLFSGLGLIGAIKMEPILIFIHYGAVWIELLIMFILLIVTLIKTPTSDGQIFVVYLPIIFDVLWMLVLTYTNYVILTWLIFMEKVQKQNRLQNGAVVSVEIPQVIERPLRAEPYLNEDRSFGSAAPRLNENAVMDVNTNNSNKCCVCYVAKTEVIFYRCGHFVCCNKCGMNFKFQGLACPICRAPIRDVLRVYT